jgi:putative SOS response-associated peptidase YedK
MSRDSAFANQMAAPIHDRMPVFLLDDDIDEWLNPNEKDLDKLKALLVPAPEDLLVPRVVSQRANSVKNDDPECLVPAELLTS